MNSELIGQWRHDRISFGDAGSKTTIGEIDASFGTVTVKGPCEPEEMEPGKSYRFFGTWSEYIGKNGKAERQFHFSSHCPALPLDSAGIITYLTRAGEGRRLGPVRAMSLYEEHGEEVLQKLRDCPELAVAHGVPEEYAVQIGEVLRRDWRTEQATIELMTLFNGRGLPRALPRLLISEFGTDAARKIKRDPYMLMRFRGVAFATADKLWCEFGHQKDRLRRQVYQIWDQLDRDSTGSTWHQAQPVIGRCGLSRPMQAIRMGLRMTRWGLKQRHGKLAGATTAGIDGPLAEGNRGSVLWLATSGDAAAERALAGYVAGATREAPLWPAVDSLPDISDHQREQLQASLRGRIAILGGSPGTGKTFAAARLVQACEQAWGPHAVAIAAPTGKAAVRISEAMLAAGVESRATTVHSMLGVEASGEEWSFKHNEGRPLPHQVIVIDESSMLDAGLMRSLLSARGHAHIIFIGDTNQLPPVGNGAPLRDMIVAGVPYGELREIKRNSGGIVEACAAIRDRVSWRPGDNLHLLQDRPTASLIVQQIEQAADALDVDPVWGCQLLVATNDKGGLSRKSLNAELQAALNPNPREKDARYAVGDKVICLTNGVYNGMRERQCPDSHIREFSDLYAVNAPNAYVANGEIGQVINIIGPLAMIRLDGPTRYVSVSMGNASWDLAYAITVHKSQGSEWPCVVVLLDPTAHAVCDRSWLYTAISRAKSRCVLIGDKQTADRFCQRQSVSQRKTFLAERIACEVARIQMEGI